MNIIALRECLERMHDAMESSPELNMQNYDEDEVEDLNAAMTVARLEMCDAMRIIDSDKGEGGVV